MITEYLFAVSKRINGSLSVIDMFGYFKLSIHAHCLFFFRMIGLTLGFDKKDMVDVKYRRIRDTFVTDAVVQEMYVCASVEFLMTVAHVFFDAYMTSMALETSVQTWTTKEG